MESGNLICIYLIVNSKNVAFFLNMTITMKTYVKREFNCK